MSDRFLRFDPAAIRPEHASPAPERILSGAPRFTTWNVEEAEDGHLFSGYWEATPGKWSIAYDEWEFCTILSGISIVTEQDGEAVRVAAGDSFVIRPGFEGTWEVVETTRKLYVIRLP